MEIQTKFNLDDKVYAINLNQHSHWVTCRMCKGAGKINVNDIITSCPLCHGRKGMYEDSPRMWFVYNHTALSPMTIGMIRMECTKKKGHNVFTNKYMMVETGINGGVVWEEANLFATREEAQAECDKRNQEKGLV